MKASSFADPADVAAFKHCKSQGHSDQYCFKYGDNGIGYWGDDTTQCIPMCALPPEDIIAKYHSLSQGKHKRVQVHIGQHSVICVLADLMPHKAYIKNGAGIDLNSAAVAVLGQKIPLLVDATWNWI